MPAERETMTFDYGAPAELLFLSETYALKY